MTCSTANARVSGGGRTLPRKRNSADETSGYLRLAAGILAFSVMTDSGIAHHHARYRKKAMVAAPVLSAAALAVAALGSRRVSPHISRAVSSAAIAGGLVGTAYHFRSVGRRPGGRSWHNLFYKAPVGAPGALAVAGSLGLAGQAFCGRGKASAPAASALGLATAGAMIAASLEAALLHFRGAFHNPAMRLPVLLPPAAALALGLRSLGQRKLDVPARILCGLTACLGLAGSMFHAYGVHRNMGGWRNARQNLVQGPPVPAPLGFTALGIAGLGALRAMEEPTDHFLGRRRA